jgi:hypothetical protein
MCRTMFRVYNSALRESSNQRTDRGCSSSAASTMRTGRRRGVTTSRGWLFLREVKWLLDAPLTPDA